MKPQTPQMTDEERKKVMDEALVKAQDEWEERDDEDFENFPPTLSLKKTFETGAQSIEVIVKGKPYPISWIDKAGKPQGVMVQPVNFNGVDETLFLSAESLKRGFSALWKTEGNALEGKTVVISRRPYTHKLYGPSVAYNVNLKVLPRF